MMPASSPSSESPATEVLGSSALGQAFHTLSVRSLTLVCRFALVIMITRTLSPADYGAYSLVSTVGAFGTFLCGLNLFTYVFRAVPGLPADSQLRIFKTTLLFETVLTSAVVVAVLLSGQLGSILHYLNAEAYREVFVLGLLVLVMLVATAEFTSFFQAQARIERSNWVDFIGQAVWVLPLLALRLAGVQTPLSILLWAQIAGGCGVVVYAARHIGLSAWWRSRPDWKILRTGLAFSVPLIVPTIGVSAVRLGDRLILSHYNSVAEVGVYSFASVFLNTLYSFTAGVIFGTFGPRIFAAHNRGDHAKRDMLQTYMLKVALLGFVVPYGMLCLAAKPLVELLARPEYARAASVLPIMGLSSVALIVGYPANYLLMLNNRVGLLATLDVAGIIVGLTANFILIPRYSYFGAAVAGFIGMTTTVVLQYAFSNMFRFLRPDVFFSLKEEMSVFRRCVSRVRAAFV